jgi:signal transduction histidine kinase
LFTLVAELHSDVLGQRSSPKRTHLSEIKLHQRARSASLGTLTASIAHEISQPLTGILTNASAGLRILDTDSPNIDSARGALRRVLRDGQRVAEIISGLRALFSNKATAFEPVNLNEVIGEVVTLMTSELRRRATTLRLQLGSSLPRILGDRLQLQQVILNLLLNAVEAMKVMEDSRRRLVLKTECDVEKRVQLSVVDTGVGFEPQDTERLFDAFYTTKQHGMGIGLSVSRSIIERHGGRLWARANKGPGATFLFHIPNATCRPAADESASARLLRPAQFLRKASSPALRVRP